MADHVGDIPRPMYAFVWDEFLYDLQDGYGGATECMLYGLSSLPGRAWGVSALLKDGALVQHLPVHAFTRKPHNRCPHNLSDLQVWSCYGWQFATHEYKALAEMPLRVYMKQQQKYESGEYWFTAAPYNDHYSSTPDQHKHFNFLWLNCGCLAAMPGNRIQMYDSSFVELPSERPNYIVNTRYWFPERIHTKPFDKNVTPTTG